MRLICAWCGKTIEEKDDVNEGNIAYYFCEQCLADIEALEEVLSKRDDRPRSLRIIDE